MLKTNIILLDENWTVIHQYKARVIPHVDEFIYINSKYHKVVTVIHTPDNPNITVVIKEYKSLLKKD